MNTPCSCRKALLNRIPAMLGEIETLVNIDSGSYDADGVTRVARWIGSRLADLDFEIAYEPVSTRGDRLCATRKFGGRGRLMILGHSDTVWPIGTAAQWPFSIAGDRATGPGVGDMKGGLIMAIHALEILFQNRVTGFESIQYLLVSDEELGSPKNRSWIEDHARDSDWVLVLEPARPGGGIVTSRGAVGALFVEAAGVSAHAAVNYHQGASALRELAAMVEPLEALTRPEDGIVVNVGRFDAGAARQVIPHQAVMHLDIRARTPEQVAQLDGELALIIGNRRNPRVQVTTSGGWTRPIFPAHDRTRALYLSAKRISDELGIDSFEVPITSGGSDASFCGALGVATLDGMGPICFDICSREETMVIESLADRGAIFAGVIAELSDDASRTV